MGFIFSIVGVFTGVLAFVVSIFGVIHNRFQAMSEYYSVDRDINFIKARKKVYTMENDENLSNSDILSDPEVALIISYFHFWGLMVKKRHLPFYIFKSASGPSIIRMFDILRPAILERRNCKDNPNPYYAEYFEWLYYKIKKYNKF